MKQQIRNNIFETNSSSTHTLVLRQKVEARPLIFKEQIPIMSYVYNERIYSIPKEILSYIYTLCLIKHDWFALAKIKQKFDQCIFQKPLWELPNKEDPDFCDDVSITSFCDLANVDLTNRFDEDQFNEIINNLEDFVFGGLLIVTQDYDYHFLVRRDELSWYGNLEGLNNNQIREVLQSNSVRLIED